MANAEKLRLKCRTNIGMCADEILTYDRGSDEGGHTLGGSKIRFKVGER